jgi:transcriptional regulator with XRE-family HTH domain
MNTVNLIEQIKSLSSKKGVSPTTAYVESGVGKDFAYNIKKGSSPSIKKLQKIADYFGVTTDYLLNGGHSNNIKVYDEEDNIVVLDDETREIIDSLRKRPDMKMLFSVSKGATKEDIIQTVKIIEALKDNKEGD